MFGNGVVESSVMNGGHYIKGKEGMSLIAEVFNVLLFKQFLVKECSSTMDGLVETMTEEVIATMTDLDNGDFESFKSLKTMPT